MFPFSENSSVVVKLTALNGGRNFFHNGLLVRMLLIESNLRSSSAQGSCGHNSKAVFIRDNNFFTPAAAIATSQQIAVYVRY